MSRRVDDARAIFDAAVAAVQPDALFKNDKWEWVGRRKISSFDRIFVAGMGKAALATAAVLESILGHKIVEGVVVVPDGYPASLPSRLTSPTRVKVIEGGHPLPTDGSRRGARRILDMAGRADDDDLLVVLISGGGSAVCVEFEGDISLEDAKVLYSLLLESGADIDAVNTVRKHISRVGGGRLAAAASPASVLSLVISDVVGDDLSVIASGPTTADPTTFADAQRVLEERALWSRTPDAVRDVIERGIAGRIRETPKPGADVFQQVTNCLLATNKEALEAAAVEARKRGYRPEILASDRTGEAREVGVELVRAALARSNENPTCLIAGGETTVTIRGQGKGGRNQEMALAAAMAMQGVDRDIVFLSGGTDGIDGTTDAAGAWATPATVPTAKRQGFNAHDYLENNDSHTYFLQAGNLLKTGHTHTNVMDVQIILSAGPNESTP